jgi:hypothetical protein
LYYAVSAKQNFGIDDMFRDIAKSLPRETTNKKKGSKAPKSN